MNPYIEKYLANLFIFKKKFEIEIEIEISFFVEISPAKLRATLG